MTDTVQDVNSPAYQLKAITPSDSTEVDTAYRMIYVGQGGDLTVEDIAGNTVQYKNLPTGLHVGPFFVKKVKVTGTTASALIGYV